MFKIYTIGEILVDLTQNLNKTYTKHPGGAPFNVAVLVKRLGGKSKFIGSIGSDSFGDFLYDTLIKENIDTSLVKRINAPTMLAIVSIDSNQNRSFTFYSQKTADQFIDINLIRKHTFDKDILHFCTVSLRHKNNIKAHRIAIKKIKDQHGIISFDVNFRQNLWNNDKKLKRITNQFIKYSDIVKFSEEEWDFLFSNDNKIDIYEKLFNLNVQMILITRGEKGARLITKNFEYDFEGFKVDAKDTTGAGDAFIGAILYKIQILKKDIKNIDKKELKEILEFACLVAASSTKYDGAISSYRFENIK